jgi:NDP-sugar pyrophosphorylase family protein
MKAMILAAGLGTRLRPLTLEIAKPAAPLLCKPLALRLIEWLTREGATDFRLNLHHLPDSIREVFRTTPWDALPVSFSYEPEILGTAGGLKANEAFLRGETFLMANADIVADFSLQEALAFHRKRGALATLILYRQEPPFRYFPVRIDQECRLRNFKGMCPGGALRPDTYVFTGVHILEPAIFQYIPDGRFCEINDEVYPGALANGEKILGFPVKGYWNDLGDPARYLEAQRDLFLRMGSEPRICSSVDVEIASDATVGPFVSLGKGCVIEAGTVVENAVLLDHVVVRKGSAVRNCIIGPGVEANGRYDTKVITRTAEALIA